MAALNRLRQVGPDVEVAEGPPPPSTDDSAALGLLLLSLKTISQRAIANLRVALTIGSVASVWWLFNAALPTNPTVNQLIGLGLYGAFVLAVHRVSRR